MPFKLYVTRTVNGTGSRTSFLGLPDEQRPDVEDTIAAYRRGDLSPEATLTLAAGGSPDTPSWERSWRWADIRDMWIEEA